MKGIVHKPWLSQTLNNMGIKPHKLCIHTEISNNILIFHHSSFFIENHVKFTNKPFLSTDTKTLHDIVSLGW